MRCQGFITLAVHLIMCISGHKTSNKTLTVVTKVGRCGEGVKNSIGYLSLSIVIYGIGLSSYNLSDPSMTSKCIERDIIKFG